MGSPSLAEILAATTLNCGCIRRFRKEARLLKDVQNDHITRLIEVGEDDGTHYLVMEFVAGVDLKTWLAGRPALLESDALGLIADLAHSLVDAHAREVIHRDIKPENILLKLRDDAPARDQPIESRPIEDFTLKLTDFGIARHVHQSESMELTRAGAVIGTPKYMSPEQSPIDPFATPKPMSRQQSQRLSQAIERIIDSGVTPEIASKL